MSAPTYELLKREEEGMLVLQAHKNPKFVEDAVRDAMKLIVKQYAKMPDDVSVRVTSESLRQYTSTMRMQKSQAPLEH